MKIKKLEDGSFRIRGSMNEESDYKLFKTMIKELNLQENQTLHLVIKNAQEMHPSIYGLLFKLYRKNKVRIILDITEPKLAYYLRDIHLLSAFNVTLMNPDD